MDVRTPCGGAQCVGVVGAGTMGSGIGQVAATHGCTVALLDADGSVVRKAVEAVRSRLSGLVDKGKLSSAERDEIASRLRPADGYEALSGCDLVIEAVVEDRQTKASVFVELEKVCRPDAVLASNTSSLSISSLSEELADPGRLVGMHFFNPAPVMPLVEIIAGRRSRGAFVDRAFDAAVAWGKTAVRAKDTPGFIVNRVARPYYLEALRILGDGAGGVEQTDRVMRAGGFRMGPFETMDLVGIDVNYAVSRSVYEQLDRPPELEPHPIQDRLVRQGHLGRKTGRGFYDYSRQPPTAAVAPGAANQPPNPTQMSLAETFCERAGVALKGTEAYAFARIVSAVMREAKRLGDQQVASEADIDLAMMKGVNYPRGPLAWAEAIGWGTVGETCRALASRPRGQMKGER